MAPQRLLYLRWPTSGTHPRRRDEHGDERLDAVEDRIDEAKEAADRVEDNEGLGLRHRETDQHRTFEPSGDDRNAGENPSQGRDAGAPGEASER